MILGLINEKQEFVDTLLVPFKENVEIKTIEDLKREYPRAVRIGDAVVNFFKEIIMGMYEDTLTPGEIIYRCRKLGAKHMRARITFAADNWLSVKKVLVEAVLKLNGINEKSKLSSSQFLRKIKRAKSETKVGNVWRNFSEIVVKNMKSGFLDSASYGPEFVEKERILEVEDDTTKSFPISTSSDVLL
ncbi:hypothetical protein FO519_007093 [Halicephalobus sp. NKZ332]|nr:hypothetical protein FO519_007093 [Halicephalobus sp. NKZ332]